jgi:hypothetical protein
MGLGVKTAPVAGSQYWFSPDSGNGAGIGVGGNFDLMTDNYDSNQADFPGGNFPTQNTVVYTGLSGPDQTIWTDSVPNGVGNYGIIGFEIVAVPEPSSFALLGLGIVGITGFGLRRRKLAAV